MLQVRNFYAPGWCSKETFYSAAPTLYFKLQPTSKEKGHVLSSWPSGIKLDNGFFSTKWGFPWFSQVFPLKAPGNVQKPCLTTGSGVLKDHAQELHFLHANDLPRLFRQNHWGIDALSGNSTPWPKKRMPSASEQRHATRSRPSGPGRTPQFPEGPSDIPNSMATPFSNKNNMGVHVTFFHKYWQYINTI